MCIRDSHHGHLFITREFFFQVLQTGGKERLATSEGHPLYAGLNHVPFVFRLIKISGFNESFAKVDPLRHTPPLLEESVG